MASKFYAINQGIRMKQKRQENLFRLSLVYTLYNFLTPSSRTVQIFNILIQTYYRRISSQCFVTRLFNQFSCNDHKLSRLLTN